MANRERRPSDPTVAAALDGRTVAAPIDGGQTTAVPSTRPADKVELAWSSDDAFGDDEIPERVKQDEAERPQPTDASQSWGATLRIAGLLLAGGLVLAGTIVLGRWVLASDKPASAPASSQSATAPAAAQPTSENIAAPTPTATTSTAERDKQYIQTLNDHGITFSNPDAAIGNGKQVCQDLSRKVDKTRIIEQFRTDNPSLAAHAEDYVNISVQSYCPQFAS